MRQDIAAYGFALQLAWFGWHRRTAKSVRQFTASHGGQTIRGANGRISAKVSRLIRKRVRFGVRKARKIQKKASGPAPYSKEYMEQKWGSTVKNYAEQKGISKKKTETKKIQKTKSAKLNEKREKPSFGFFNYIITYSIGFTFLVGILNFERARLSRKFPALEPYIDTFFETIDNLKIFILDLIR